MATSYVALSDTLKKIAKKESNSLKPFVSSEIRVFKDIQLIPKTNVPKLSF